MVNCLSKADRLLSVVRRYKENLFIGECKRHIYQRQENKIIEFRVFDNKTKTQVMLSFNLGPIKCYNFVPNHFSLTIDRLELNE